MLPLHEELKVSGDNNRKIKLNKRVSNQQATNRITKSSEIDVVTKPIVRLNSVDFQIPGVPNNSKNESNPNSYLLVAKSIPTAGKNEPIVPIITGIPKIMNARIGDNRRITLVFPVTMLAVCILENCLVCNLA